MSEPAGANFEEMYREHGDPWSFATSWYERRRYELTTALLPKEHYRRAFEPACSIGELTRRLSTRCDAVVAWDLAPTAVATARERLAACPHVTLEVGAVPDRWPAGSFDLIMLSEVGYYCTREGVAELRTRAMESLEPGGTLVGVHWLGHSSDHVLHGDEVHDILADEPRLDCRVTHVDKAFTPGFRADVWVRR